MECSFSPRNIYNKRIQEPTGLSQIGWHSLPDLLDIHTFRLSGSSVRPAYPGFIVINTAHDGFRASSTPSNMNLSTYKQKVHDLNNDE